MALAECAAIERGKFAHRPRNAPEFYGGDIPFVQTGDVTNSGGIISSFSQTLNERGLAISKMFPKGTLLMTIAANIGDVAELGFDAACTDSLVAILPKDGLISGYLRRYLEFIKPRIHYLAPQNAQKNISVEFLEPLLVLLPPSTEQEKIVAVFGACDKSIQLQAALVAAKTDRLTALRRKLLFGKQRFPKFGRVKWRRVQLSEILRHIFRPVNWSPTEMFRLVSIRRRCGGLFRREDLLGADYKTTDLHEIRTGDFLVSKRQVVHGAWAMVTKEFSGCHVSKEYSILVNKAPDVLHMPFFDWLSHEQRMWHLAFLASDGVHREKLIFDSKDFLRHYIELPPTIDEQQRIVEVLDACDQEIRLLEAELEALKLQKRGLMQKLLTGDIRVKT